MGAKVGRKGQVRPWTAVPSALIAILILQAVCGGFLLSDILISVLGLSVRPIAWQYYELAQLGAVLGLLLGVAVGIIALRRIVRRSDEVQDRLRVASGAFQEHLEDRFKAWQLTPAEREVALFSIKGMSVSEIAALRSTSEGTVKAQANAIYRKAEVSGRPQLLSLFLDDLMGDALIKKDL